MSSGSTPSSDVPNPLWDRRWRLVAGASAITAAIVLLGVVVAPTWRWSLFWWGACVGVVASALIIGIGFRATRGDKVSPERRLRARRQLVIHAAVWTSWGLVIGSTAAMFDTPWLDVALVALLALMTLSIAVLVPVAVSRSTRRHS